MSREYKLVKQYSFDDSWTIHRKTTFLGFSFVQEISEWSDMFGKRLPMVCSKGSAEIVLHAIKLGGTTYKWRLLNKQS